MEDIQKIKEFFSKPLNEGSTTFKVGDKVTYLGHPAEITAVNKEMTGDITYNVYYDKGQGKTKVTNIFNKGGDIKPLKEDFGQALFNRLNPKDEDLEAIVNILIQDPKIRKSPDQASFKDALENYIRFNSDRNSIGQAAVRALSYRNTGGRYGSGFDKIFNMLVDKNNLSEAKTDINKIKKRLDALGIKYEMSATDKVRPFKVIYKPVDKSDEFYDKFEDIVDLFNLKSFVKLSMNEAKEEDRYKRPIVTNKQGEKFILQGFSTRGYYLIPYDGSKYWEPSSVSKNKWIPEKSINWDDYNFTKQQFEKLKASHGKSEKEINKKFQDMNEAKEEDVVDTITMDVPLFLRMLEYSKEDAAEDMDLHDVTEKAIALNKSKEYLSMEDYNEIVGAAKEIDEATDYMKRRKAQDDYVVNKKDKPAKSYNPTPSGKTDYMKRREKELAEAVFAKLKK
jgi:hypothetical protein